MIEPFKERIYVTRPVFPTIEEVTEKLRDIWAAKWLTNNGPQHTMLEHELKTFLKVPYLSLFNNGTIALMVACQSLRLSGEVITTPFTFAATPHVLSWNNIAPIFCDVDAETMNIDADKIESMITPHTTAILAVHVFGTPCDVEKIQACAWFMMRRMLSAWKLAGVASGLLEIFQCSAFTPRNFITRSKAAH